MIQRIMRPTRLVWPFLWRELKEQYAGLSLGVLWSILQPVILVMVYWAVFSSIMQVRVPGIGSGSDLPFIVFLLAGILPWFMVQEGVTRASSALIARRAVIRKVSFPSYVFIGAIAGAVILRYGLVYLGFLFVFFFWSGGVSAQQILIVPILLALLSLMIVGLGLLLSSVTVFFRDLEQILPPVLMVTLFTSPTLYPSSMVPEAYQRLIYANPYSVWAQSFQGIVLWDRAPSLAAMLALVLMAGVALIAGVFAFRRLQPGFADVL